MDANLGLKTFLPLLVLYFFIRTTHTNNVSISEKLRHPRVSGRIVKLYSGIKPQPISCDGEGFQEDPVDCAVFYRCVKGANKKYTVFRYQCGPGTVFDPETEICNHPKSTKRANCGGYSSPSTEAVNENEINEILPTISKENEIDGLRKEIPSPIKIKLTAFLDQTTKSDVSSTSTQKLWSSTEYNSTPSGSSAYSWITTAKELLRATRSPLPRQTNPVQSGEPCTSDGFMGDIENCRTFYRCVGNGRGGFIRYEFSCSELTLWDDEAQACNHAWAVKKRRCGRGSSDKDNINSESRFTTEDNEVNPKQTIQSQLQISYGSKVNQVQTQISKGPVKQNQTQINYGDRIKEKNQANSHFKQNQTQISQGSAVSQTQTQISHGQKGSQTQLQIDHSKESSQSQTQIHEENIDNSASSQDEESEPQNDEIHGTGNDNNECTKSGFMGDSKDCKKFYRCVDNGRGGYTKYEFSCGEGTIWDPNVEACNHAWAVKDCKNKTSSETMAQDTKTTTSKTTTVETIPEKDEDVGYGGQSQEPSQTTTTKKDKISTTTEATQVTEDDGISSSTSVNNGNVCTSSGFIGDTDDCKKFYRCVDNGNGGYTRYEFSCGEGTVWDSSLEACNHAWAVEKCGNGAPDKTTAGTTTTSNSVIQDEEIDNGYPSQGENNMDEPTETTTSTTTKATTVSSTSSSSNGNTCSSSGFMGDQNDCKKFYRCVDDGKGNYTRYEFTCGEGTVWDQSIESCNHPSNDNQCRGTMQFNDEPQHQPAQLNDESQEQPVQENSDNADSTSTSQPNTVPTSEKPQQNENTSNDVCESEGFFANSANCKKFYRCVDDGRGGYTKYDFDCGDGTVWDQQSQTCNHESNENKCIGNSEPTATETPSEPGSTTQSTDSNGSTTTTTRRPSTENNDQSNNNDQCESEGFYANSNDCKKFYRCVSNDKGGFTKYDFSCGEGTIWVQEIQACDHDTQMSNCSSQGTASNTPSSQSGQEEQPTTKASTTTTQSTSETDDGGCSNNSTQSNQSNECKSEGFYPNNNDCRKFYRCVDNGQGGYTKYEFTCGEGTAWDPDIQSCNHESQVKTCQESQSQNQPEQGSTENSAQTTEATSTTTESSSSNKQPSCNDKCEEEGYFGDSSDCQKFYRCVDNGSGGLTKYDFTCGEGTIWDQDLQTCNHAGDVKNPSCNNNTSCSSATTESSGVSSSTSSGSSSTTSDSSSTSSTMTTASQNSSDCSQSSTEKPQKSQVNCTKAGFYADPEDCKKFYRCVDWDNNGERFSVYHFECGEGTIWDPALDTCNHEESVYPPRDCSGTQSQAEESTTTTTEKSTTQETTTTEDSTTTQQSTTASPTTTETTTTEETTTEQSTTQKSTTTEKTTTTTEKSTTEQSTTEKPTTEQSTTQKSTTTEKTTTTTEKSTTEQSTTEKTTTEQSTTQQSTTESSTTEQTSTEQSSTTQQATTTEVTTTEESSTEQSETTTQQSTTEGTTESSTEESTTQGSSTTEQTTDSSTTEQSSDGTTTENSQESSTEGSSSSSKDCPETEDDQYLYVCPTSFKRHPKYCNMFYQCTEDNDTHELDIAVFKCPNNTIYDESKNQCVEEDKADKKCDGEMAERRQVKRLGVNNKEPIIASKEPLTCPSTGYFPFENSECSPSFIKCDKTKSGKLRGYVNQCPEGYVYWSISRRCEANIKVRDCKKTDNDWRGRFQIPVNVAT